ncbi:MAG: sulfotransferase, partial [Bacteroidales bacterium]|nr:sulfotransferase [Bacteroidales bacterium]
PSSQKSFLKKKGTQNFFNVLKDDEKFSRLDLDIDKLKDNYNLDYEEFTVNSFYKYLAKTYLKKKKKQIIGDKDPRNLENVRKLNILFPESFFIHLIRDPRDIVLSKTKANWSKNRPFWVHAFISNTQYNIGVRQIRNQLVNKSIEVKYEELIEHPKRKLSEICMQIGVEFDDEMLNFGKSAKELVSESEMQWKKETLGPILKTNKFKWQNELSIFHVELINSICYRFIKDNKYEMGKHNLYRVLFTVFPIFRITAVLFTQFYKLFNFFNKK